MKEERKQPEMTLHKALIGFFIPLCVVLALVITGHDVFIALFLAMVTLVIIALLFGFKFDFIEKAIIGGGETVLGAVLIMMMVGILIGVWMSCGSVPAMLYYGLKIINPRFFLPIAFILCVITSLATGTSWGTAGTMGVALMGIAAGMGIPLPMAAGAIVSGANVGDKMSPLSDTTLLASATTGTKLFDHIVSMLYTTVPASLICLVTYTALGWKYGNAAFNLGDAKVLIDGLFSSFNINPLMLIPPLLVIVMSVRRIPANAVFGIAIIFSIIWAMIFQGVHLSDVLDVAVNGFVSNSGVESLDNLLSRGGVMSMSYTTFVMLFAGMFAGLLKELGILATIMGKVKKYVSTPGSLITAVVASCIALMTAGGGQYATLTLPGVAFRESFDEMDIHSCVLSRTMEDTGTLIGTIIPWDITGIFFATALGVATLDYAPFALLALMSPILAIANGWLGFGVFRRNDKIAYNPLKRRSKEPAAALQGSAVS